YSYGPLQALHSFPTRRSSDLLFNRACRKAIDPTYSAVMALSGVGVGRYVVGASNAGQVHPNAFGQQDTCSGLGKRSSGDAPEHARRTYPTLFKAPTPSHCKFCQLVHSLFSISVRQIGSPQILVLAQFSPDRG